MKRNSYKKYKDYGEISPLLAEVAIGHFRIEKRTGTECVKLI